MSKDVIVQIVLLVLRHGLTAFGLNGILTGDEIGQTVGAVATAVGLVWSAWRKISAAKQG